MPELPEAEVTRRRITPYIKGKVVLKVSRHTSHLRNHISSKVNELTGEVLEDIERRGKALIFRFPPGSMVVHLGLTGVLKLVPSEREPEKHDHIDIHFDNGLCLRFNDQRRFGSITWTESDPRELPTLKRLGPEPLTEDFNGRYLFAQTKGRRTEIKKLLMDGTIVAGLGNIYSNEALHKAGLNPETNAGNLTEEDCDVLVDAVRLVLSKAINEGMSGPDDSEVNEKGAVHFEVTVDVYGRKGKPCRKCGTPITQIRQGGRSTWYCSKCQPL